MVERKESHVPTCGTGARISYHTLVYVLLGAQVAPIQLVDKTPKVTNHCIIVLVAIQGSRRALPDMYSCVHILRVSTIQSLDF